MGGIFSKDLPPRANRILLAMLISSVFNVGQYITTKNFSYILKSASVISVTSATYESLTNVSVISGIMVQVS